MAALKASIAKNGISTTTALKTILQLKAPANQRLRLLEMSICFHGMVNTNEPIQVNLQRQSTAGTMSAVTPVPIDEDLPETPQATGQYNATAEPTAGAIVKAFSVHPQTGLIYQVPKSDEIIIKGGGYLGLVVLANGTAVNCDATLTYEE